MTHPRFIYYIYIAIHISIALLPNDIETFSWCIIKYTNKILVCVYLWTNRWASQDWYDPKVTFISIYINEYFQGKTSNVMQPVTLVSVWNVHLDGFSLYLCGNQLQFTDLKLRCSHIFFLKYISLYIFHYFRILMPVMELFLALGIVYLLLN